MKRIAKVRAKLKKSKEQLLVEFLGWYGVFAYLTSYIMLSFHQLTVDSLIYQLLNFTGALGILVVCWPKKAYQPVITNFVWGSVALIILLKIVFTKSFVLF
jgi:hypothetical protein